MSCIWYEPKGGRFGTCEERCPDSSHDCPSEGDIKGCDLFSPFGGSPACEKTGLVDGRYEDSLSHNVGWI